MGKFHTRQFPPSGVQRHPKPPAKKLNLEIKGMLYRWFKEQLLNPKSPLDMLVVAAPGLQSIPIRLERVGQTALIARWLRGTHLEASAITLLLSDIDNAEDEEALLIVENELVGPEEKIRPQIQGLTTMIRIESKPLAATIGSSPESVGELGAE